MNARQQTRHNNVTIREAAGGDTAELVRMLEALQRYLADLDPIGRIRCGEGFGEYAWHELATTVGEQAG